MGRKPTEIKVFRTAGAAGLETFDIPTSIYEYLSAAPGPQLIDYRMFGLYTLLLFLQSEGLRWTLDKFRAPNKCSRTRMVALFKHLESLELIECVNLGQAGPDTPLEFNILIPYDADELEENRPRLWERVRESPAFRKRRASRPTTKVAGVH